jgi:hypothetical protein
MIDDRGQRMTAAAWLGILRGPADAASLQHSRTKRLPRCEPLPGAAVRVRAGRWDSESPANPCDPQGAEAIALQQSLIQGEENETGCKAVLLRLRQDTLATIRRSRHLSHIHVRELPRPQDGRVPLRAEDLLSDHFIRVLQVVSHNSCCFAPSREAVPLSSDQGPSPLSASARVWYPSLPQAWSRMS